MKTACLHFNKIGEVTEQVMMSSACAREAGGTQCCEDL